MLDQFSETIHEEMDYRKESENLKKIKENMKAYPNVIIPNVYDDFSTKNVLTLEDIPGIKITNIEALDEKGIDRQKTCDRCTQGVFCNAFTALDISCRSSSGKHLGYG